MKTLMIAALMAAFAVGSAFAEECKPVDKNGKALAGAAKTAHMKSCCEKNAVDKNGKAMHGIVKTQFIERCMKG